MHPGPELSEKKAPHSPPCSRAAEGLAGDCPASHLFNLFQCFIIKETLTKPCLRGWQWQARLGWVVPGHSSQ